MKIKQVPDKIYDKIISLSCSLSSRDIASKLEIEDNFKISHATVSKYLKANRQERSEAMKTKIADEVEKTLSNDLIIMQDIIDVFYGKFKTTDDTLLQIKLGKAITDTIEIKFKNCGSGEDSEGFSWEDYLDEQEQEDYLY